jgi:hypothetical protein
MDERELVGLLYRADWTGLSLSGRVRGAGQFPATSPGGQWWSASFGGGLRPGSFSLPDPPPGPPDWMMTTDRPETESALTLAPGKRYRLATEDGSRVLGCDGERVWQWLADVPAGERVTFERRPQPPVPGLLAPAWLLLGYRLSVEGGTTVAGRAGIVVTGAVRTAGLRGPSAGLSAPTVLPWDMPTVLTWDMLPRPERVSAVIDVELGIVLRCELGYPDGTVAVTEFLDLEVGGAVDPSVFSPAAGSFFGDRLAGEPGPVDDVGLGALKMVAGLAAGGLGAAIKYAPKRQVDPFAAATSEDPGDVMPDDEPLPAWAVGQAADDAADREAGGAGGAADGEAGEGDGRTAVSDEVLDLLYRGGLEPTPFSARLCEWTDGEVVGGAMLGAVPESARRAGLGGVGFLLDTILTFEDSTNRISRAVYSVRVGAWDRFRIDRVFLTPLARARRLQMRRRYRDVLTFAVDGQRTFRVFEDEVRVGPARTLDRGWHGFLPQLVDGSWLLGCRLSGGDVVEVDGRTGYRIIATVGAGPVSGAPLSWLPGWWLPAVAVVDASSGRLLRLTRYSGGKTAMRVELRSLSDGGSDDFGFTPPDGLPVVEERERDRSHGSDDDDLKFFGPDGRPSSPPEEVRAVVDAVKKQVDEKVAAAVGFLGSLFGGPRLVGQEVLEGGGGLERDLLGQEVAAGQRAAGHRVGVLAPDLGDVAVVAADEAVFAPEGEQWDGDALAAGGGGVIVFQVGADGGAVVLAGGVDRGRLAEAADVLVDRLRVERLAAAAPAAHPAAHPADRVGADLVLGQRLRLGEEEPVPVGEAELQVGRAQGVAGGHDVQHRELGDQVGVVERQPVGYPGAAVVAHDGELVEAELAHHQRLVPRHRALGVGLVRRAAGRLAAVAVTAQVGQDDRMILGENRGDVMPHDVGLRVAVQQQHGRAALIAAHQRVDSYPSRGERDSLEQVGQGNGHGSVIPVMEVT